MAPSRAERHSKALILRRASTLRRAQRKKEHARPLVLNSIVVVVVAAVVVVGVVGAVVAVVVVAAVVAVVVIFEPRDPRFPLNLEPWSSILFELRSSILDPRASNLGSAPRPEKGQLNILCRLKFGLVGQTATTTAAAAQT